ncbi:KH domain-containing protein HEN4 isoform X2 [Jatropha curcas]|nr:KH domain-containing protein HEN4 isoform X2 [Jatropha curcas]
MQESDHSRRRRPRQLQRFVLQPGQVAYRVVCHFSIIGGLIGTSGSVISQIRRDTGCTIQCEPKVQGSDHRMILVVGPASPGRRIAFKSTEDDDEEEEKELISVAQDAVIRVCERMWEVEAQKGGAGESESGVREGYCGLLADRTQIGAVMGRAGKNVVRMRRESGAQIRILPAPHCATKDDELIQITGTILAVKKALIAVTECLHDCPPYDRGPMLLTRSVERSSYMASSDPHAEFFPHLSSLLPPLTENTVNTHSLSSDAGGNPNQDVKVTQQEVSFRLLCSNGAAGSIIGKKGTIVRTLQNESGASIMFAAPITMSGERLVTISALENLESWYSPAQNAVILVFARSIEHEIEKGHPSVLIEGTSVTARLLVESDVVCCLNGNGGEIDSKFTEGSGADIQILEGEQNSDCASENDVVIEITGEYKNVQNALFLVTRKLRDTLVPSELLDEAKLRSPNGRVVEVASPRLQQLADLSLDSDREASLTSAMDQLGFSNSLCNASSLRLQLTQKFGKGSSAAIKNNENSSTAFVGGSELERSLHFLLPKEVLNEVGAKSPSGVRETACLELDLSIGQASGPMKVGATSPSLHMPPTVERSSKMFGRSMELESSCSRKRSNVANSVVELLVSEDIIGSVFGEDGGNLTRLRQISGAKVEVCDPSPGKNDRTVVISGTPDQTRAAQSLFQAFILAYQ